MPISEKKRMKRGEMSSAFLDAGFKLNNLNPIRRLHRISEYFTNAPVRARRK
jgi:hypothetical protein